MDSWELGRHKLPDTRLLLAGKWRHGAGGLAPVTDKYSGDVIAEMHQASESDVAEAVAAASQAFRKCVMVPAERARAFDRAVELLEKNRKRLVAIVIAETGFVIADAESEVSRAILTLRLCAEESTRIVGAPVSFSSTPGQHGRTGFTMRMPLGVVCAITPFNSPLNTVAHKIGPALAAGNAVVIKPAGMTPLSAAALCEILIEAGFPAPLLTLLHGSGSKVGNVLLAERDIAFYAFTGSSEVGLAISRAIGLRRSQLELGSISSTIICGDADLGKAIPKAAAAAFRKAGQVCTSVQRLYAERRVADQVVHEMAEQARGFSTGDPRNADTRLGPMISESAAERAGSWVDEARSSNARLACGGRREGATMEATVLASVDDGMKVVNSEIFAPVVSVLPFDDLQSAIDHANSTRYGLSAGIFTKDIDRALQAAKTLRFGSIHINETSSCRADAMPFGGVKDSGHGQEGPRYAIREMTEERLITFN